MKEKIGADIFTAIVTIIFTTTTFFLVYHVTKKEPDQIVINLVIPNEFREDIPKVINIPGVMNERDVSQCPKNDKNYIILMKSKGTEEIRNAQRQYLENYLTEPLPSEYGIKLYFLEETEDKNKNLKDVITPIEDFKSLEIDNFSNSSTQIFKSTNTILMGLEWFISNCAKHSILVVGDYTMKIDYEMLLQEYTPRAIRSKIFCIDEMVNLNQNNKKEIVPQYCSSGYIMDQRKAEKLVETASHTRRHPQDDLYVTGILVEKANPELRLAIRDPIDKQDGDLTTRSKLTVIDCLDETSIISSLMGSRSNHVQ